MPAVAHDLKARSSAPAPLRVMVVDDSLVLRGFITRMINEDTAVAEVVAMAANGHDAVERLRKRDIDVVILDIEMPVMDGLTALPRMLSIDPRLVVIMASTLTTRNAQISFRALAAGAKDYLPKPSSVTPGAGVVEFKRELLDKVRTLGTRFRRGGVAVQSAAPPTNATVLRKPSFGRPSALAIGCSTGGPNALMQVLKSLPAPLKLPVFVTQHMPPMFTSMLAENICRETGHACKEACEGEVVVPGRIYLAPGDFHMTAVRERADVVIRLNKAERENFCRPAVDPMLRSLARVYGGALLVSILTGMGQDGLLGCAEVVKAGGNIVAQDEASSVVWGMPGAVAKAGLCCAVQPISQIASAIQGFLKP